MFWSMFLDKDLTDFENVEFCKGHSGVYFSSCNPLHIFASLSRKCGFSGPTVAYALSVWMTNFISKITEASNPRMNVYIIIRNDVMSYFWSAATALAPPLPPLIISSQNELFGKSLTLLERAASKFTRHICMVVGFRPKMYNGLHNSQRCTCFPEL